MSAKIEPSPEPVALSGPVPARLVVERDGREHCYAMFAAHNLTVEGAFLATEMFLELDEEHVLELSLSDQPVRIRGVVVQLVRGHEPGIVMTFEDVDDQAREAIEARMPG